jgi:hypothetical protein
MRSALSARSRGSSRLKGVVQPEQQSFLDIASGARFEVPGLVARAGSSVAGLPGDRQLRADPAKELADVRVIAGTNLGGRRSHGDPASLGHGDLEIGCGRVEEHAEARLVRAGLDPPARAGGVRGFGDKPRFDVVEQDLGGRQARDEAALRGLADEAETDAQGVFLRTGWRAHPTGPEPPR